MRIARYIAHGSEHYGVIDGDNVTAIDGSIFDSPIQLTDHVHALSDVKLLAPVMPGKILAMGLNYTSHIGDRPGPALSHGLPQDSHQRHRAPTTPSFVPGKLSGSTPRARWSWSSRTPAKTCPRRTR